MSYEVYKFLHLIGLTLTLVATGIGIGAARTAPLEKPLRAVVFALHGIGVTLLLVAGFGMLARLGMHGTWPSWLIVKLIAWLVLVVWLSLVVRQKVHGIALRVAVPLAITALAVWAVLFKF